MERKTPQHYVLEGLDIEAIDVIRSTLGKYGFIKFCLGCAIKYLIRAGKKESFYKDIEKAVNFLNYILELQDEEVEKSFFYIREDDGKGLVNE